ncbi:Transcriptional regulator, Fis-like [Oleispira antarctica RB-8]|uniref:Transcriptional regulator, Fis-like n=1 Tax=Oleispira antarctica RB-8 TaxID=698738 RepID=R4YQD2_OLEAN|nr:Transcriptional regulator, Fis-like [Oleispira antarctica RB-8]
MPNNNQSNSLNRLSLKDLQQRYFRLLEAMSEGVYGLDADGLATFVNPAAERITGWSAEDILGKNIHQFHHHSHADGSPYPDKDCPIYKTRLTGESAQCEHEVFWRKDGSYFPVEYSSTPIEEDGQRLGVVVVFKDISERFVQQQKLKTALQQVERLKEQLIAENHLLKQEIQLQSQQELIGQSDIIAALLERISQVGPTDACVLIQGESGTGKELIAQALHGASQRKDKPIVKVNCGAIAESLIESELFGHEKGAFTGATQRRLGRFEVADGGTLFLDEIGELTQSAQVKLLRVLQEQEFERVGSSSTVKVDVRIIAATNRDLQKLVEQGEFRADLFYRLNVFPLWVPALRQRATDIPLLANYFLTKIQRHIGRYCEGFTPLSLQKMMQYSWPGNVRELYNVIERSLILHSGNGLLVLQLDAELAVSNNSLPHSSRDERTDNKSLAGQFENREILTSYDAEKQHILRVLEFCNGRISGKKGAAEYLDLPVSTLRSRMKKLDIQLNK